LLPPNQDLRLLLRTIHRLVLRSNGSALETPATEIPGTARAASASAKESAGEIGIAGRATTIVTATEGKNGIGTVNPATEVVTVIATVTETAIVNRIVAQKRSPGRWWKARAFWRSPAKGLVS
jgi:hypothetical protein